MHITERYYELMIIEDFYSNEILIRVLQVILMKKCGDKWILLNAMKRIQKRMMKEV